MFDKTKIRVQDAREKYEKVDAAFVKAEKVGQHIEDHKLAYIAGTSGVGCLIVGGAVGTIFGRELTVKVMPTAKNTMLLGYKSPQSIIQETIVNVSARGSRGHIIIDAATGAVVGRSQKEAALLEGISRNSLRQNVMGLTEAASNGKKYVDLGENLSEKVRVALA